MRGYELDAEQDRWDRRKHLELVSGTITRMAGSSAAAKGWSITLAGAAFGVAVVRDSWYLFFLGVVGLVVFCIVDGLYLHNERKFRDLYDAIVQNTIEPLSMDTTQFDTRPKRKAYMSWSVLGFYGPLILVGLALLITSLVNAPSGDERVPSSARIRGHAAGEPGLAATSSVGSPNGIGAVPSPRSGVRRYRS